MTLPARRAALHFLAQIAIDDNSQRSNILSEYDIRPHHTAADIRIHRLCNEDSPSVMHNVSNTLQDPKQQPPVCHTDQNTPSKRPVSSPHTPAPAEDPISSASTSSSASSSASSSSSSSSSGGNAYSSRATRSSTKKKTRSPSNNLLPALEPSRKKELSQKRKSLIEKAKKINSLDNSPANDRQLHVLRMVYEEITMYPSDAWIAILAIVIHRSHKQVKNWFSNERQKRGTGEEATVVASTGDRYRVRPITFTTCQDWSDEWFEEVVMIHHYRVLCNSRWQAGRALSDTSSNYDGRS